MDPKRILVVYFSRSGTTRLVARAISDELGCDVERISEHEKRRGVLGYLRSVFDVILGRPAALRPMTKDPKSYDLVLVGTPVWSASVSTPVKTFLEQNRGQLRRVAFFCTYGGSGSTRTFRQMKEACGLDPVVTLAIRAGELAPANLTAKIRALASALRAAPPRVTDGGTVRPAEPLHA